MIGWMSSKGCGPFFDEAVPRAAIAVHSFGDFQQFNQHLHLVAIDGCFSSYSTFTKSTDPKPKDLQELFRYEVLKRYYTFVNVQMR